MWISKAFLLYRKETEKFNDFDIASKSLHPFQNIWEKLMIFIIWYRM